MRNEKINKEKNNMPSKSVKSVKSVKSADQNAELLAALQEMCSLLRGQFNQPRRSQSDMLAEIVRRMASNQNAEKTRRDEAFAKRRAELLQSDRNLAEDEAAAEQRLGNLENDARKFDTSIAEVSAKLNQLRAMREDRRREAEAERQRLADIKARRESIHKEWISGGYGSVA